MESALIYRSGIFPWTCLPDISPLYVDWSSPLSRFHPHRACLPVFFTWQNCFHIILLPIFTPRKNVPTTVQLMDHRRQKIKVNIDARQRVLFKQCNNFSLPIGTMKTSIDGTDFQKGCARVTNDDKIADTWCSMRTHFTNQNRPRDWPSCLHPSTFQNFDPFLNLLPPLLINDPSTITIQISYR